MPFEQVVGTPVSEVDESYVDLAAERLVRTKEKEKASPAAAEPEKTEAAKTAPVTEAGNEEEEIEGTDKDGKTTKVKVKGGFQRKIDKLTREKSELERTVGELNGRLQTLETAKPTVKVEAKAEGDPEPKEEDFKEYKEYAKALSRWVTRQEIKADRENATKAEREQSEAQVKAKNKELFDRYLGDLGKVREKYPDFQQVIGEAQIPDYIHNRLVRMENGAEITYQLFKNKEVLGKILELNAAALKAGDNDFSDAYWEFGAFVRSLNSSSATKTEQKTEKPVSQAPTPITPVGGPSGPTEIDADKIESVADYRKLRNSGRIR